MLIQKEFLNKKFMIIDKENMREVISKSALQLAKGLDLARDIKITGEFKNVIICGIGGSALPANILNSLVVTNIPFYIHRDYGLPKTANEDSLVICISYSGNTEETVSALQETIEKKHIKQNINLYIKKYAVVNKDIKNG